MAKLTLTNVSITINGVDLSDHASEIEIDDAADQVDLTAFSIGAARTYNQGFKDATITATFFQDFAAAEVHATLQPIYQNATAVTITVKPTSGIISATNPAFQMIGLLFQYNGIAGAVGAAGVVDAVFHNATSAGLVTLVSTDLYPSGLTFPGPIVYPG